MGSGTRGRARRWRRRRRAPRRRRSLTGARRGARRRRRREEQQAEGEEEAEQDRHQRHDEEPMTATSWRSRNLCTDRRCRRPDGAGLVRPARARAPRTRTCPGGAVRPGTRAHDRCGRDVAAPRRQIRSEQGGIRPGPRDGSATTTRARPGPTRSSRGTPYPRPPMTRGRAPTAASTAAARRDAGGRSRGDSTTANAFARSALLPSR